MRAVVSREVGGPDLLKMTELPDPTSDPGQVVIAVEACAINYPDVLVIEDKYQAKPPRPFAPGGTLRVWWQRSGTASPTGGPATEAHGENQFRFWARGTIAPRVAEIFPFERGGEAIAKIAAHGAIGKPWW